MKRRFRDSSHIQTCALRSSRNSSFRLLSFLPAKATAPITRSAARLQLRVLRSGKVTTGPSSYSSSQEMSQTPRLSWHPNDVRSLIHLLLDEQSRGMFVDGKPTDNFLYERLAGSLNSSSQMNVSGQQVLSKVNALKIDYRVFRQLKEQTGVGWDDERNTVDADPAWWAQMAERNKYCKNFRYHGLDNFEELHTLFHNTYASGALGQASTQRAPTREECDERMRQLRGIPHGGGDIPLLSEHMDSGGNVNNTHSGGVSLGTSSGSRKRGSASVTGGRALCNAVEEAEIEYLEELKELAKSKRVRYGSSSSKGDNKMTECVNALQACKPRLSQAQFCLVVACLSASPPLQTAFLAMTDEWKSEWAHGCT